MRLASIDIGTVTSRLLIADVSRDPDGRYVLSEVERHMQITHLGKGLSDTSSISAAAIEREVLACEYFLSKIREVAGRGGTVTLPITAVATSAMRDAKNRDEVLAALAGAGLEVTVISGDLEAELSFMGAMSGFSQRDADDRSPKLLIDVGGGSTELVYGTVGASGQMPEVLQSRSFNVGSSRITELFLPTDPPGIEEVLAARQYVVQELEPFFSSIKGPFSSAIAVAGTATSVVSVRDEMAVYDPKKVHGSSVSTKELDAVWNKLSALNTYERRQCVGLEPNRAPVILAGLIILQVVLQLAEIDTFVVSETDILQGIVMEAAAQGFAE
jgi:exopolyphosphatase/guanosine-5'-triphosphate,3'-diphosphate pyrophosphatase